VLAVGLARRVHSAVVPARLPIALLASVPLGLAAWAAFQAIDPEGRVVTAALLVVVGALGASAYLGGLRGLGVAVTLPRRGAGAAAP
jgi:hypothetical protein